MVATSADVQDMIFVGRKAWRCLTIQATSSSGQAGGGSFQQNKPIGNGHVQADSPSCDVL